MVMPARRPTATADTSLLAADALAAGMEQARHIGHPAVRELISASDIGELARRLGQAERRHGL